MPPMHLVLLDSDERQRLPLKRLLMQYGFTVTEAIDLPDLYAHIDRHYASSVATGATPLLVLLTGVIFSSEFVDKVLPAMRRSYPMVIAIQCPEEPDLRVQLFDRGADLCLSDHASVEEVSANLWAQSRRLPDRWMGGATHGLGVTGRSLASQMAPPVPPACTAMNDRSTTYQVQAPGYIGHLPPAVTSASGSNEHSLLPDARLAEANAELQRTAYGTWVLAHEDWILVNPIGAHIGLTGVERRCVAQLADNERREFPRHLAGELGRGSFKSMSVVVSRMRKKVNRAGVPLPLHTVHGMGYVFIGKLVRKPAA